MAQPIAMPQMGVTMESGTIVRWLRQVGEVVHRDEPVMEIQTDKVNLEVTSDLEGTLLAILVGEGREVPVGTVLAYVGAPGETAPEPGADLPDQTPPVAAPAGRVRATPAARSRARALGLRLEEIRGTGPSGRIQARDVAAAQVPAGPSAVLPAGPSAVLPAGPSAVLPAGPSAVLPAGPSAVLPAGAQADSGPATGSWRDLPVTGMRRVIAQRMAQSFHSGVPVLLTAEAVMDRADEALARLAGELERRSNAKVGYLPLVIKAAAAALLAHPQMNGHWLDDRIRLFNSVQIGVAVALPDGLAVPVLRDVERKGLAAIAAEVATLAGRARQSALSLSDLEGGTFTVSNLGSHQIGHFAPVINPPQIAILGVGRATMRPVVRDGQILALPVLPLSLVFDHRAVDGAPAAAFLDEVRAGLEEPYRLLI